MVSVRRLLLGCVAAGAILAAPVSASASGGGAARHAGRTPIKHLVVIFDENISFDHYFGTYPKAANPPGEPTFIPLRLTPNVNGLTGPLAKRNPNLLNTKNSGGAANPFRLDRSQNLTADQNHGYSS